MNFSLSQSVVDIAQQPQVVLQCNDLPDNDNKMWLMAEIAPAGLCNQLFGVFSYAPVALLYNASLIIGDMYSRHTFKDVWPIVDSKWSKIPFSRMFNFEHFSSYWRTKYGLVIVDRDDYKNCIGSYKVIPIKREPDFWPQSDAHLVSLIKNVNISSNTLAKDRIYYIDAEVKFTTMFDFRDKSKQSLLVDVMKSLQPSPLIQQVVDELHRVLPRNYVAAHLRLEGDIAPTDFMFNQLLKSTVASFVNHTCFQNYSRNDNGTFINAPVLYLSSGIFKKSFYDSKDGKYTSRSSALLKMFKKKGFHTIVTRDKWMRDLTHDAIPNFDIASARKLHPEQEALADLFVVKSSHCFIPDLVTGSSFSYIAMRLRLLDQGIYIEPNKHEEYYQKHIWAYSWGI